MLYMLGEPGTFFHFFVFICHKDLKKTLYFSRHFSNTFFVILVFMLLWSFPLQTARLCYTGHGNPWHNIKRSAKYLFSIKFISGWYRLFER